MKQYLVFLFSRYYPSGGWRDLIETFDTYEEAYKFISEKDVDYFDLFQIVNRETGEVVSSNDR